MVGPRFSTTTEENLHTAEKHGLNFFGGIANFLGGVLGALSHFSFSPAVTNSDHKHYLREWNPGPTDVRSRPVIKITAGPNF